jgi:hypothetical protein
MARKIRQPIWTISLLKAGFEKFFQENGHYPSALEIDSCPYLCTSRLIQLKFSGLLEARRALGLKDISYAVGEHRKNAWAEADSLSLISEKEIGKLLVNKYGEICVHEEKKYGDGRNRVDFFVYAQENFAVEVFNTYTIHGVTGNLNSKLPKYYEFPYKLIFVITGGKFSQNQIDKVLSRKRKFVLKQNMQCVCSNNFEECIKDIKPRD